MSLPVSVLVLLAVLAIALVAYRASTEAERRNFARRLHAVRQGWSAAWANWYWAHESFFASLRARTRFAPVTPALIVVNVTTFVLVVFASSFDGDRAIVEWGASVGPRTTNGEWWRLVTSLFVHAGLLQLAAGLIAFLPLSFVLERLVGSIALLVVYIASGVFTGLAVLSSDPLAVTTGASGAICGLYGLALATWIWRVLQQPRVTVPWGVLRWITGSGLVFLACNRAAATIPAEAEFTGFLTGFLCGVAIARGVGKGLAPVRRSVAIATASVGLAIAAGVPVHGITDVRADIDHMIATDQETAATFRAAAAKLTQGRTSERAMVRHIERAILPALAAEADRLAPAGLVPDDQQAVLAAAREYLRIRIESWQLRTVALRKGSLAMLKQADRHEGMARDVLVRIPYPLSAD